MVMKINKTRRVEPVTQAGFDLHKDREKQNEEKRRKLLEEKKRIAELYRNQALKEQGIGNKINKSV